MSYVQEKLHFSLDEGLVPMSNNPPAELTVNECQIILEAYSINNGIDFIFFRRFADRASQPVAFIVDNTSHKFNDDALAKLHRDLWFFGRVPLLYVEWENRVDVVNCHSVKNVLTKKRKWEYSASEQLIFNDLFEISEQINRYSMFRLADGTFWEDSRNSKFFDENNSAHHILIEKIKSADTAINGEKNHAARKLLLLSLLIKYLEDRKVFESSEKDWFSQFTANAKSFLDVLKTESVEKISSLFARLEEKFNGDIFSFPESNKLNRKIIKSLIHLGEKNEDASGQLYFWDIYSFEHIPVEVLGQIYQYFTQKNRGAIFTPVPLVELILDYAMPYDKLTGSERILDPTCGSGIFLVSAFRRMISVARKHKNWKKLNAKELKTLLQNSIFGIELPESGAAQIAAFSLALAICDALRPEIIWKDLKFDKLLSKNIIEDDFANVTKATYPKFVSSNGFDIVIGNPPFISSLTEHVWKELKKGNREIPDNQLAYYILTASIERYLSKDGVICMIQPQGLLYNEKSLNYRINFFKKYTVHTILDFISIRGLFYGADTKIIVIKADKREPEPSHKISHLTFRRTKTAKRQVYFELDYYDYHTVTEKTAVKHDFIWRVNLLGGGRLFSIAKRIKEMETIQIFLDKMKWKANVGFIVGKKNLKSEKECEFLHDKLFLVPKALLSNRIDKNKLGIINIKQFTYPGNEEMYNPPLMIISMTDNLDAGLWEKSFLAYNQSYIAINRINKQNNIKELRGFFDSFINYKSILQASLYLLSNRVLTSKATSIKKSDIVNLPWPQGGKFDVVQWENELLTDVSEYMADYIRLGQDSELLQQNASEHNLDEYSQTFLRLIQKYFNKADQSHRFFSNGLILIAFTFSGNKELSWLDDSEWEKNIHGLIDKRHSAFFHTKRIVRILTGNSIILIKPSKLRYWIKSTAIRDVDDVVDRILHNGETF